MLTQESESMYNNQNTPSTSNNHVCLHILTFIHVDIYLYIKNSLQVQKSKTHDVTLAEGVKLTLTSDIFMNLMMQAKKTIPDSEDKEDENGSVRKEKNSKLLLL